VTARRQSVALALLTLLAAPALAVEPPNVVFILLDDVGYGDLGAYGGSVVRTPQLDAFSAEGVRFSRYYSMAPLCSPARAAILTGHHPLRFGIRNGLAQTPERSIPTGVQTVAELLRARGYATGHFGKWHVGGLPSEHGFERSIVEGSTRYLSPTMSFDGGPKVVRAGHLTELITDDALSFIAEHRDGPFFANVWYKAAHAPHQPPEEWAAQYPDDAAGRYAALLSHADEQIGRLLAGIRSLGLDSRTLVILASDNGGAVTSLPTNGPLRGYKRDVFEGGIRVPLIVRWTGTTPAGAVNDSLVLGIDFVPTLAEIASAPRPPDLPGRSVLPALLGHAEPPRSGTWFWETSEALQWVEPPAGELNRYAVLRGDWKLVRQRERGAESAMLFDLASDPFEQVDLAAQHPERVQDLELAYRSWRMRESRPAATLTGLAGASASGPWVELTGGLAVLDPHASTSLRAGDATFALRATPAQLVGTQRIASSGGWTLDLTEQGTLHLHVTGEQGALELESATRLVPGVATDVAVTTTAWRQQPPLLRLLVDGRVEAESLFVRPAATPQGPVRLAAAGAGAVPFRGLLWDPRFHLVSLAPEELGDHDLDGIANAEDVCIGSPDGPWQPDRGGSAQRDSDADGFGNVCDADVNGDGRVGAPDQILLAQRIGARAGQPGFDPDLDLDGSGVVGFLDLSQLMRSFGMRPGPSGRVCTRDAPCAAP
jgi:arylsulfatase A-like enzyme